MIKAVLKHSLKVKQRMQTKMLKLILRAQISLVLEHHLVDPHQILMVTMIQMR